MKMHRSAGPSLHIELLSGYDSMFTILTKQITKLVLHFKKIQMGVAAKNDHFSCLHAGEFQHETYTEASISRTHYASTCTLKDFESTCTYTEASPQSVGLIMQVHVLSKTLRVKRLKFVFASFLHS